ncbi:AAA family ATPase [Mitsuaria sp. TWR114]|uniref:AAA family ATPase n=1 Tax=Mitsuaria sp. TWR114 TaxID=2601731 RepID=UPI0011BFDBDE|nr:AAA family ATPase [Mitsuaria sp. TWR114]TXD95897.1 AAA family ATPase [Mitsuaria sp. TWR114]
MPISDAQSALLANAFRPHAPIEDPNSFVGRQDELRRVRDAVSAPGLHVVLYGERGCGKTSLANVATADTQRIHVFCEESASFASLLRDTALKYQSTHPQTITFDAVSDSIITRGMTLPVSRLTGNQFLQLLAPDEKLCIVLDELDRVQDKTLILSLAELAKNAATNHSHVTLVMVGVNETADGLLAGHLSNFRHLRQVPLTRMTVTELQAILTRGENVLGIKFGAAVNAEMVQMSDQMPFYLHLLATSAVRFALSRDSTTVGAQDLRDATLETAQDLDHSLRETYELAVLSKKGSHVYRRLIWALASLDGSACPVGAIYDRANAIARDEGDEAVSHQALGAAVKRLMSPEKRGIVAQVMAGNYKFKDPLMKGFVRLMRYGR